MSVGTGLGIERDPLTYRIPDLAVFRAESLRQHSLKVGAKDPYIWTAPDLLVECLSPSNRKGSIHQLLADYEQIAVPEVWLLDPEPPQFTSYHYESGALREHQKSNRGVVSPRFLPGLTVDLADLWAAFERGPFGPA
jgi:Uma2 family endonuclease